MTRFHHSPSGRCLLCVVASVLLVGMIVSGCGGEQQLIATPNLYRGAIDDPFADVPPELQSTRVEMLYATDRRALDRRGESVTYGTDRSMSLKVGTCVVRIGEEGLTWDELRQISVSGKRGTSLPVTLEGATEMVRFPSTPLGLMPDGTMPTPEDLLKATAPAKEAVQEILQQRLAKAKRKELFLFIHGINSEFHETATSLAGLWHFLGREGVPMVYSWPAGGKSGLVAYVTDRESGEFTLFHLKMLLETLAQTPALEKIHIISHSRGTDIAMSAIRELTIKYRAEGKDPRGSLKLGNVVLAAPDIDLEVFSQRITAEHLITVPERLTIYVSPEDRVLKMSSFIHNWGKRAGQTTSGDVPMSAAKKLGALPTVDIIQSSSGTDFQRHEYFRNSPSVCSDVILLLRYGRKPGAENGRPLRRDERNIWQLDEGYPGVTGKE